MVAASGAVVPACRRSTVGLSVTLVTPLHPLPPGCRFSHPAPPPAGPCQARPWSTLPVYLGAPPPTPFHAFRTPHPWIGGRPAGSERVVCVCVVDGRLGGWWGLGREGQRPRLLWRAKETRLLQASLVLATALETSRLQTHLIKHVGALPPGLRVFVNHAVCGRQAGWGEGAGGRVTGTRRQLACRRSSAGGTAEARQAATTQSSNQAVSNQRSSHAAGLTCGGHDDAGVDQSTAAEVGELLVLAVLAERRVPGVPPLACLVAAHNVGTSSTGAATGGQGARGDGAIRITSLPCLG